MTTDTTLVRPGWAELASHVTRELAAVTTAGAAIGLLVGGVGGRLAMLLLARLNPEATGVTSDDGFTIGQFTGATLNLLVIATLFGVLGGGIYYVLRGLMIGPRWFRLVSISVGPAVVVGSQIVHPDGVDFTALDPAWLGIALFVVIPGAYAALLAVLAERRLDDDARLRSSRTSVTSLSLLLWLPILPAFLVLVAGLAGLEAVRRSERGSAALAHPAGPWLARGALGVVFAVCLVDLVQDTVRLV